MSSAIVTWTGHRSALERANDRWNITPLPKPEQARHERLIGATRRIERKPVATPPSRYQQGDRYHWRRTARTKGVVTGACPKCLGKGWITVDDGAGGVDYDECPQCAPVHEYTGPYPTAGDLVEVEF